MSALPQQTWVVYMLRCADGTLYTGVAADMTRRLAEHNESPKGARYTRGRRPVRLVYTEECASRSDAQKREAQVKALTRDAKCALIKRASMR